MVVEAEFAGTPDEVWRLWADPRQLERWWGPPAYPATVTRHELVPGGEVRYQMTGPEGDRHHGGWSVVAVDAPGRLVLEDFFADEDGEENTDLPRSRTTVSITLVADGRTAMVMVTHYPSSDALAQVLDMGMEEGIRQALGQIDEILAVS